MHGSLYSETALYPDQESVIRQTPADSGKRRINDWTNVYAEVYEHELGSLIYPEVTQYLQR